MMLPDTNKSLRNFLYIEDDPMSREVLQFILEDDLGHKVTIFPDSEDFMTRLEQLPQEPDLIFLDMLCDAMLCMAMPMLCSALQSLTVPSYPWPCVTNAMLHCAFLCRAWLCFATLCAALLCFTYALLCCDWLCFAMLWL